VTEVPTIRRRLASMVYEALLLLGIVFIGFLLPNVALGVGLQVMLPGGILLLYLFLLIGGYFVWHWRRNGQTLAMRTWKFRLEAVEGGFAGYDRLLLRYILAWPSVLLGIGVAWALFDRDRQFLHDRLSATRLVVAET
jgi:uncharacterized RDD family membrane protein YckC